MTLDNIEICKICNQKVENDKHFYKFHQIKMAEYFQKFWPRFDKLTKEEIPFKNKDQYFDTDFVNKTNLSKYIKTVDREEVKKYCVDFLLRRKEKKNLQYFPSQVELKSLIAPTMTSFFNLFGCDYYKLCEEVGLKPRFSTVLNEKVSIGSPSGLLLIDSREQKPLKFSKTKLKIQKLEYGDYTFLPNPYNIFIERKSLKDFISTLSRDIDRFKKEIERAKENNAYLIILVEDSLCDCLSFNYLPYISKFSKLTPEFIFHNVRELLQSYLNIQFLFVSGRGAASKMVETVFLSGLDFRSFDNQFALERKLL